MGKLRIQVVGGIYHVVARGADRRRIFVDDEDYATYIRMLATVVVRQGWTLLCFCLMPNHIHLVVRIAEANLDNGMQWLHSRYARHFNDRHVRVGHLFEGPYKESLVTTDEALVRTVGYVVVNPVSAALCKRAIDWPWGSHAIVMNPDAPPAPWLSHRELVELLEAATGVRCYADLIATREREAHAY